MDLAGSDEAVEKAEDAVVTEATLECPICLQAAVHPVELPCGHIFCYLCIKGIAAQRSGGRCAICRQDIPRHVLTNPTLKDAHQLYQKPKLCSGYQWFYECRGGGWWMYDERTMQELERSFETNQATCQVLIAGHIYEIDFSKMIQYRANNRNLFRRIKRDIATAEKRGIAGIRLREAHQSTQSGSHQGAVAATASNSSHSSYHGSSSPLPSRLTKGLHTNKRNLPECDYDEDDVDEEENEGDGTDEDEDDEEEIDEGEDNEGEEQEDSDATIEIPEEEKQDFEVRMTGTENCVILNVRDASSVTVSRSPYQTRNGSRNQSCNAGSGATPDGGIGAMANSPNTSDATDSIRVSGLPSRSSDVTSIRIRSSLSTGTTNAPVTCLLIGSSLQLTFNSSGDGEEAAL